MPHDEFDETGVAEAWNANAERWTADVRAGFDVYRDLYTMPAFLDFMPAIAGRRVIDLGCGEGSNTRRFAGLGAQMTGVDLSEAMIAKARQQEAGSPLGIAYEICSFTNLEIIDDNAFDCALSTMALMDGPDFDLAMCAANRVLVVGGELCFSILHPCFVTPVSDWLRSSEGACPGLRVGRYFDTEPFQEHWKFSKRPNPQEVEPFRIPRFPRTLSAYINAVASAGFKIRKIGEPRPDEALIEDYAWLGRWHEHAPMVLFVSAVKV